MGCCILIAGMPASGKTTFALHLSKALGLPLVSKDRLKEIMYDHVGFKSLPEKISLSIASTGILYYFAETMMQNNIDFILENNFENVQKQQLKQLLNQYSYRNITIRFGGDIGVIYHRYIGRINHSERHKGHSVSHRYPETPSRAGAITAQLSLEEFSANILSRGIHNFSVGGDEISVDTTSFDKINYDSIITQVRSLIIVGGHSISI